MLKKLDKIPLIIRREYLTRVRKKSFIIMSILGPVLMAALFIVPAWLATSSHEVRKVVVVDNSLVFFRGALQDSRNVKFNYGYIDKELVQVQRVFEDSSGVSILFIPENIMYAGTAVLESPKQPGLHVITYVQKAVEKVVKDYQLIKQDVDPKVLKGIKEDIQLINRVGDEESSFGLRLAVGMVATFLIYMFIFIYGAQIMRGVMEEKTSRIVEVIISSVKPFHLMMGKVLGISMVGLTQFVLWITIMFTLVGSAEAIITNIKYDPTTIATQFEEGKDGAAQEQISAQITAAFEHFYSINWPLMVGAFLFYFIGGYLLYGSLFAAVGSAVDSETDTQQFMLPISIPLILSIIVATTAGLNNPEGAVTFWFSMIPLTSPIVMMVRIPFGIDTWELVVSALLLIFTFIGSTWISGKIYRTGILMYGKKVNYKEMWKWIRYRG